MGEIAPRSLTDSHGAEPPHHSRKCFQPGQRVVDEARQLRRHRRPIGEIDRVTIIRLSAIPYCLMQKSNATLGVPSVTHYPRGLRPEIGYLESLERVCFSDPLLDVP